MKKLIVIFIILLPSILLTQQFQVDKVKGNVFVQRGLQEDFTKLNTGDILDGNDLIMTEANSFIQLDKDGSKFILDENSALGLNFLKKITINELLLALAMEEIRNVPKTNNNEISRNTAVYGSEEISNDIYTENSTIGNKKINGAKKLALSGYEESALVSVNETYRKHPSIAKNADDRIFFANLLLELQLNNEALEEFSLIQKLDLNKLQEEEVSTKIEMINIILTSQD